ncbi:CCE_0567 family metalloprotein [Nitrincola alkalisediminis]|uniref:CCE_0567 family metalloprotein n=1 Tax=Nitrincola alkalisediminis TaxID=1366656 RepID=UPI00187678D5|nr:CCE_0567 family metalloprotein [Nitrincola alkalisediminis]
MNDKEIKALEKQLRRARRIAGEQAMELHDLVEDGLPAAYAKLPTLAAATYVACEEWDLLRQTLEQAQQAEELRS